ncbi:type I-B CRISPR-associated protein Cas8b1/Cst1 [Hellea balneolensis]|uniref:type I-B CRISPR-associated protein Cas8b1/Cst1 n=1 Tax=Hellea balneolensis TaxID=287478 RepID=UPI00047AD832|nr:type I-B CRISPR-associated protein Cas8b1/Cst1 [Hellea balneolensis]
MELISGNCHCGAIQFELSSSLDEFTTCDCSLCVMRNAVMLKAPETALTIISGEDKLSLYQWNMKVAKHYFCSICGIYVFHNKRAAPDHFGVNVHCLQNIDVPAVRVRATEGETMTVNKNNAQAHWPGPRI